jgi:hypothetical protein
VFVASKKAKATAETLLNIILGWLTFFPWLGLFGCEEHGIGMPCYRKKRKLQREGKAWPLLPLCPFCPCFKFWQRTKYGHH